MTTRRGRRLWWLFGVAAATTVVGYCCLPLPTRWAIVGYVRGEAFYKGMPTSYWAAQVYARWHVYDGYEDATDRWPGLAARCPWLNRLFPPPAEVPFPEVLDGDPGATEVLAELLGNADAKVRDAATCTLYNIGPAARGSVPALLRAMKDSGPSNRESVRMALLSVDEEAARAAGITREEFGSLGP